MCVILSNAYKGQNVTDLTAPLKPPLMTKFQEIIDRNFTIFVPVLTVYQFSTGKHIENPTSTTNSKLHRYIDNHRQELKNAAGIEGHYAEQKGFFDNLEERISIVKKRHNMTLLEAILSCNQSAMVVYGNEIDDYEAQLRFERPKDFIAKSEEELFPESLGWVVSYGLDPLLEVRFQAIFQAGITQVMQSYIQFIRKIRFKRLSLQATKLTGTKHVEDDDQDVKGLEVKGNFVVVFYLYVFLLVASSCTFVGEQLCRRCLLVK